MAKPSNRVILFLGPEGKPEEACQHFTAITQRMGLSWQAIGRTLATISPSDIQHATYVVEINLPGIRERFAAWEIPSEEWPTSENLGDRVSSLVARLLGGKDSAPPPAPAEGERKHPPKPPKPHTVTISKETAGRRGKGVTVISNLPLNEEELQHLATELKNRCGTGGTAKDGRIEIQGDQRDRLTEELEKKGYKVKRSGG